MPQDPSVQLVFSAAEIAGAHAAKEAAPASWMKVKAVQFGFSNAINSSEATE